MRVALVNDLKLALKTLKLALEAAGMELAWVAEDGERAVELCQLDTPDVVLMDLVMPKLDGAQATQRIMQQNPCAVLIVTASMGSNQDLVYEAMGHGAVDVTITPRLDNKGKLSGSQSLLQKLKRIERVRRREVDSKRKIAEQKAFLRQKEERMNDSRRHSIHQDSAALKIFALGASTGGPRALAQLLEALPENFPAAVVLVQHIDANFTEGLVQWLGARCALSVLKASEATKPEAGKVYVAAQKTHLKMDAEGYFRHGGDPNGVHYPSVDTLFKSLAACKTASGLAAVLTGMGADGAQGLLELRREGWLTLAQDEVSSVVYGMPKAAVQAGAVDIILSPAQMAAHAEEFLRI